HLAAGRGIGALGAVDQKRVARRHLEKPRRQVRLEFERMGPRKVPHHADREIPAKDLTLVRVMMADRGHTAQQVLERAPPEPYRLGHAQLLADRTAVGMVDVAGPGGGIRVDAAAQLRKEVELQVVVGVDQTGHDKMAGQIEIGGGHGYAPPLLQPTRHLRTQRASSTAGVRRAASYSSGLPAASKSARSGPPIVASAHSTRSRSATVRS